MKDQEHKVSFCITCKGRLGHLERTLKLNLENNADYPNTEFVVLDYDSQDGLEDWIKKKYQAEIDSGKIRYAKYQPAPHFHMAHAKNMAHRLATGDILCNLDADNITAPGFAKWLNEQFSQNPDIVVRPSWKPLLERLKERRLDDSGIGGRIAISQTNFVKLHGYDEHFAGWGPDDCNFEARAIQHGLTPVKISYALRGYAMRHSDAERIEHMSPEVQKTSQHSLEKSHSVKERVKRKLGKVLFGEMSDGPLLPVANTDGDFGCGTVRVNFKDEVTLGPVHVLDEPPAAIPFERAASWRDTVAKPTGQLGIG
jgi:hypothetical protein